ncbi:pyridoxamine 5'-phosphate oxidase family protein [bacterium]|nr:pyridoxamine 5'-phosphate oxidase family protein [bacterium]RQV92195.1 MAG: pyridoxamine 5'-phosphate oxidase [bacterium]
MNEVIEFLTKNQIQYLATVGLDGKPKVRPFMFKLEDEGKLYFTTSNQNTVYNEMKANPNVEICVTGENYSWIRLSGKVVFSDNIEIKARIVESNELVKSIFKTPDNPILELFYLVDVTAVIADLSGNPPKTVTL